MRSAFRGLLLRSRRKRVEHAAAIKTVGRHTVTINFYRDINAEITVLVGDVEEPEPEPEAEEAEGEEAPAKEAAETPAE